MLQLLVDPDDPERLDRVRQRLLAEAGLHERLVRERERQTITGLSRTQWWLLEQRGLVPARLALSCKSVAWRLSDLLYWVGSLGSV